MFENITMSGTLGFSFSGRNGIVKNCKIYDSPAWGLSFSGDVYNGTEKINGGKFKVEDVACENVGYGKNPAGNAAFLVMNTQDITFDNCSVNGMNDGPNKYGKSDLATGEWNTYGQWELKSVKKEGKKYYRIINLVTGKALTYLDSKPCATYEGDYEDEQLWTIEKLNDSNYYYIRSKKDGLQLHVASDGTNIRLVNIAAGTTASSGDNQFILYNGTFKKEMSPNSGLKFYLYRAGTNNQTLQVSDVEEVFTDKDKCYDGVAFDFEDSTENITVKNSYFGNIDGAAIMIFKNNNKNLTVDGCYFENYCRRKTTGEGAIKFFDNPDDKGHTGLITNNTFILNDMPKNNEPSGTYTNINFSGNTIVVKGDLPAKNNDVRKYLLGLNNKENILIGTSDMNSDGKIDICDLVALARR